MKYLHYAALSVFTKPTEEDIEAVKQGLMKLVPFNLEEAKVEVKQETAKGFNEQKIKIFSIRLEKQAHTTVFLKNLLEKLTQEQKDQLVEQRESRLGEKLHFFIRFDKEKWMNNKELVITDSGDCFHVKLSLAVYPSRRPAAMVLVEKIFKPE